MAELLRERFGTPYDEIAHEVYLLDNTGRIDTMLGTTVIELKSDRRPRPGGSAVKASEPFFFEKRTKKLLLPVGGSFSSRRQGAKVFCFFFPKKKAVLA